MSHLQSAYWLPRVLRTRCGVAFPWGPGFSWLGLGTSGFCAAYGLCVAWSKPLPRLPCLSLPHCTKGWEDCSAGSCVLGRRV